MVKMVGSPVGFSRTTTKLEGRAPFFAEHTEEVLLDLCGLSWEDIEKLKDREVI
jgi:crotonobetainyl-CoA:carnitine CoA-transferase CaiB-like acyl-CoA transferase